jgi:acetolactate synthase I/II/III large subunit
MAVHRTVARAIVDQLVSCGIRAIFGLPGSHLAALYDACYADSRVCLVTARHEQGAGFMALGHARLTGIPAVVMTVPGPGLLNAGAAIATAYACNVPVLCLAAQIESRWINRGLGCLHEVLSQTSVLESCTKWTVCLSSPESVSAMLMRAFQVATTGRHGPVVVEVPSDLARTPAAGTSLATPSHNAAETPSAADLDAAADALASARTPLLLAGGGAAGAAPELQRLSRRLGAPIVFSENGLGIMPFDDPMFVHPFSGQALWSSSDVVCAVGTRMSHPFRAWPARGAQTLVRIDIDARQIRIPEPPTFALVGDAVATLREVDERLSALPPRDVSGIMQKLSGLRESCWASFATIEPQASFCRAIDAALTEDAVVCVDSTQVAYFVNYALDRSRGRTLVSASYQGTMGSALPMAIGAKLAQPQREVLAIAGDGGFLATSPELAVAVQLQSDITVVVFEDGAYGEVLRSQTESLGGRIIGSCLVNPKFDDLARSFGAFAQNTSTPEELGDAIRAARERRGPTIVTVRVGPMPSIARALPEN